MKILWLSVLGLCALFQAGCATQHNAESGFLMNYSSLKAAPDDRHELVDINPKAKWASYKLVQVEPVAMNFCPKCSAKISNDERGYVADYFEKQLKTVFGKDRMVTNTCTEGTIKIRAAVTDLDTSSTLVNLIAAALVWPVDYGGVTVEMEAVDGKTGERIAAVAGYFEGSPVEVISSFFKFGHTRLGIDKYVRNLHKITTEDAAKTTATSVAPPGT